MKLLYCYNCHDIFLLIRNKFRYCKCKKTKGKYLTCGVKAIYSGTGVPLGIANTSFVHAILNQPNTGDGKRFEAFVIPKECPTFKAEQAQKEGETMSMSERILVDDILSGRRARDDAYSAGQRSADAEIATLKARVRELEEILEEVVEIRTKAIEAGERKMDALQARVRELEDLWRRELNPGCSGAEHEQIREDARAALARKEG